MMNFKRSYAGGNFQSRVDPAGLQFATQKFSKGSLFL